MSEDLEGAASVWSELSRTARDAKEITYKELGSKVGIHHRSLRFPLGQIQEYCLEKRLPPLTVLAVRGDGKGQGAGFTASRPDTLARDVKRVWEFRWSSLANPFLKDLEAAVAAEASRRENLWRAIKGSANDCEPALLRNLGLYGGAQGIWVDVKQTRHLTQSGVAVSILHTGRHYPDDISEDGLIYHYPDTSRPSGRDRAEVEALKEAKRHRLPIFVIMPGTVARLRHVELGWVTDWDDEAKQFLILTGSVPPQSSQPMAEQPFNLLQNDSGGTTKSKTRPGQAAFRFHVLDKYGSKCAVCPITQIPLIKAAHICGKADKGSDDWRNGLPLCSTHHDAFDAHMFAIRPGDGELILRPGLSHLEIGITEKRLATLRRLPHEEALKWRFAQCEQRWRGL